MSDHLNILFLDLNAYFASVEQQCRPELRGRPVAVVPVHTDTTCCIAASYEAKGCGVRTGTNVGEAKRLCPELHVIEARPELYVRTHHRIVKAVDSVLPVEQIHSIDEMHCRLMGEEREPDRAVELALCVKRAIAEQVGDSLRCSVGLAPNRLLAKLATNMQKPDGLIVIHRHELPQRLYSLELTDLPGIGTRMARRLNRRGINTIQQLCDLSELQMVGVFESVLGRYWFRWLHGDDVRDQPTLRRSIGHQHVLPPNLRNEHGSRAVAMRLLHKAAARLRRLEYWADRLTLTIRHAGHGGRRPQSRSNAIGGPWSQWIRLNQTQDTLAMAEALGRLWSCRPLQPPLCIAVTLSELAPKTCASLPLFPAEQHRTQLAAAIDRLNYKYGRSLVHVASMHEAHESAPMRIAFRSIPDPSLH